MKVCNDCIYCVRANSHCAMLNIPVDIYKDYCSHLDTEPKICFVCNRVSPNPLIDSATNNYICPECLRNASTCSLCKSGQTCSFETDPSPLPKVVMQQVRQGNMMMQTQVRNPERVKITCANGCPCFQESECMRQYNQCAHQQFIKE